MEEIDVDSNEGRKDEDQEEEEEHQSREDDESDNFNSEDQVKCDNCATCNDGLRPIEDRIFDSVASETARLGMSGESVLYHFRKVSTLKLPLSSNFIYFRVGGEYRVCLLSCIVQCSCLLYW